MKRILIFAFATLMFIALSACSGGEKIPEQLIVGNWAASAPSEMEQGGMTISLTDMVASYNKDKTASGSGKMKMSGPGFPQDMELSVSTKFTWIIEEDQLKETITEADVKLLAAIPGMPDISGMIAEQMKAQGESTSTIVKLDKNSLELKNNTSGQQVAMTRQ